MEESFDLLSSMSPKVTKKRQQEKTFKKPACSKLALNNYFRRSSIIKSRKSAINFDSIIDVESSSQSSEVTSSSGSKADAPQAYHNHTPIVISDSENSDKENFKSSSEASAFHAPFTKKRETKHENKPGSKRIPLSPPLSQDKIQNIQNWLDHLDDESTVDSNDKKNASIFTEVSVILPGKNSGFRTPLTKTAANSTFVSPDCRRFDQLFDKKSIKINSFNISGNTSLITEDLSSKKTDDDVVKDSFELDEGHEIDNHQKNHEDSFERMLNESLETRMKKMFLRDPQGASVDCTPRNNVQDDEEECFSLLDSIYGASWRDKQTEIIQKTEPRNNKKKPEINVQKRVVNTEKIKRTKSKISDPNKNDNNLLKKLHSARLEECEGFPWYIKTRDQNDSDSESSISSNDLQPIKLNFNNDMFEEEKPSKKLTPSKPKVLKKVTKPLGNPEKTKANESPWAIHLKNICDSDSSDSLENIDKPTVKKGKNRKNAPDSSSSENIVKPFKMPAKIEKKGKTTSKMKSSECKTFSFLDSLSKSVPIGQCDMSARIFRDNYKQYKVELADKLFKLYNENIFDNKIAENTALEWSDRLLGTAGACHCRKTTHRDGRINRYVRIVLASKILDSADRLRDTLVHEMCHAATWVIDNVIDGHGSLWKSWANRAMKVFPELPPIKRCHQYEINTKYTYKCTGCGYSIGRHTKSLDTERKRCGYCYGKFEVLLNKTTKKGETKSVPATPKKQPTGFALFIKENYANYKSPLLKHGDVMKILSQKFAELKMDKPQNNS